MKEIVLSKDATWEEIEAKKKGMNKSELDHFTIEMNRAATEIDNQVGVIRAIVGVITGTGEMALSQETLRYLANVARTYEVKRSTEFAGFITKDGKVINNISGNSDGNNGDLSKLGGTRWRISDVCQNDYHLCSNKKDSEGRIILNYTEKELFENIGRKSVIENAEGLTGGVQGLVGKVGENNLHSRKYS